MEKLIYEAKMSEDLIIAISQYNTVNYTVDALKALKDDFPSSTTLVLFDGTPMTDEAQLLMDMADIHIRIKERINSLPHIWNLMFGAAKLTRAKYLYWQGSDMEIKPGALYSMMQLIKKYDIVNPVKIDNDIERFKNYKPLYDKPQCIAGINDSAALFRLDKMPFFPFDYEYAPYQFETSALGYKLWRQGMTSVLDPNAVIFHHVSKDIEFSPKEREIGSTTWDKKKDIFLKKDLDDKKKFFLEKSIMNSEIATKIGFPCHLYGDGEIIKKEKVRIAIGAPTYNDSERIRGLFTSLITFTDFPEEDYKLVMIDDGTQDPARIQELKNLSEELDIPLILNKENRGIPYCWNRLTEYYDAEYVILFNDDIQISDSNWLKNFIYLMDNNPHIGNAGWPLVHIDAKTGGRNLKCNLPDETVNPGRVGSPVGCAFGFRKHLWEKMKQPDESIGFWEDLVSFYEEISFGFEIAKMGFASIMLPTPPVEHWGSQTFANNRELSVRKISNYISKEDYLKVLEKAETLPISLESHKELLKKDLVLRMDYSRVMFAKKWGCTDTLNHPQSEVHTRLVDPLLVCTTKWIDKNGEKREHGV